MLPGSPEIGPGNPSISFLSPLQPPPSFPIHPFRSGQDLLLLAKIFSSSPDWRDISDWSRSKDPMLAWAPALARAAIISESAWRSL